MTVLTAAGVAGRSLRLKGGYIQAIDGPPDKNDMVIDGRGGVIIPGLINSHDHLELNTFQRLKYRERYCHSLQWIEDIESRFESDPALTVPRREPLADRLLVGAVKNLLSGVTTVCHHNPLHRALRRGYPIRVVREFGFCHSLFRGGDVQASYRTTPPHWPWIIHLAEGVDGQAAAEFEQLAQLDLLQPNTILVHGVGLAPEQRQALVEQGGGLIWCPGSNHFLFGQTSCVAELAQVGKVALGSDSRLSGEIDLLAELRVAAATNQLPPERLLGLVTELPARLLRLQGGQGELRVNGVADLVLLPPAEGAGPFEHFLSLERSQLELVLLAGRPLVASPWLETVFKATRTSFGRVRVDGVEKLMPRRLVSRLAGAAVREPGFEVIR